MITKWCDMVSVKFVIPELRNISRNIEWLEYMDDQKWDLTWDDEDIVEDFSEILRKEKNILRLVNYYY